MAHSTGQAVLSSQRIPTTRIAGTLAIGILLLASHGARAERYRVQIGVLPPAYVNDSATYCNQLGAHPPGFELAGPNALPAAAAPDPVPVAALPAGRDRTASAAVALGSQVLANPYGDHDTCIDPPPIPPTPEFLASLLRNYSVTDPAEVTALWKWYLAEPANLDNGEKTGNSAIRQIMALGAPLVPSSTARPDLLNPAATRATVRATDGVIVRETPWGKSGRTIPFGTALTVTPVANGVWYNVVGEGWVPGLWLDLR